MSRGEERELQMITAMKPYLEVHLQADILRIQAEIGERYPEILATFKETLNSCVEQTLRLRESTDKGRIKFVTISTLSSSLITETFDLKIDFFDQRLYLDENEASAYWRPDFLAAGAKWPDEGAIRLLLANEIDRVTDYDILELQYVRGGLLCGVLPSICKALAEASGSIIKKAGVEDEVAVLFGAYMEKVPYLTVLRLREEDE
jgi:hypothetical protein